MNQWSRARKRLILFIIFAALVVLVGGPLFFLFYHTPSCSDGRQNGDETGIDCGGACTKLCAPESLPLIERGDPRLLTVATSTYEVVAVFENPNALAEIKRAHYLIEIFDAQSLMPVKTLEGETYVPKAATFAVFEGPFSLEEGGAPTRATLTWDAATLLWEKSSKRIPELIIKNTSLSNIERAPRIDTVVSNTSLESVSNIDLVVLVSDIGGNIFAASKTFVEELRPGSQVPVVFTWPRAFVASPAEIKILTRIFPDRSYLR